MSTNLEQEIINLKRRLEDMEKRAEDAEEEVRKLQAAAPQSSHLQTDCYVRSIARASKTPSLRKKFYAEFVRSDPVKGGFVGSAVYRDFALASKKSAVTEVEGEKFKPAKAVANAMMKTERQKQSIFSLTYLDNELQQSYALVLLMETLKSSNKVHIGHQFQFKESISVETSKILSPENSKSSTTSSLQPNEDAHGLDIVVEPTNEVVQFTVDACVSCSHLGVVSPIAAIVYKPNNMCAEERGAQCDMYACNFLSKTKRACIAIEVAGGVDVSTWKFTAWAYFDNFMGTTPRYEKSVLFVGSGLNGLLSIVRGLEASCDAVTNNLESTRLGERLGPVVCHEGNCIYKVYDNPTYRSPNLEVVRYMLDPNADTDEGGGCTILKMKYFESNWTVEIAVEIFTKIAKSLKRLHEKFGPHGDIRLANLLSCGHIVDFDFVGREKYPVHLVSELPDGKRHHLVEKAISENRVGDLAIKTEHDWHSLSAVMQLFHPTVTKHETEWERLISCIKGGNVEGLSNNVKWKVRRNQAGY